MATAPWLLSRVDVPTSDQAPAPAASLRATRYALFVVQRGPARRSSVNEVRMVRGIFALTLNALSSPSSTHARRRGHDLVTSEPAGPSGLFPDQQHAPVTGARLLESFASSATRPMGASGLRRIARRRVAVLHPVRSPMGSIATRFAHRERQARYRWVCLFTSVT